MQTGETVEHTPRVENVEASELWDEPRWRKLATLGRPSARGGLKDAPESHAEEGKGRPSNAADRQSGGHVQWNLDEKPRTKGHCDARRTTILLTMRHLEAPLLLLLKILRRMEAKVVEEKAIA